MISRRTLVETLLFGGLVQSIESLAIAGDPAVDAWIETLDDACRALGRVADDRWQQQANAVLARAPIARLIAAVDVDRVLAGRLRPDKPKMRKVKLPLAATIRVTGLAKGAAIVPHGHRNVATARLVLRGRLRARHFDRVEDRAKVLLLRPSIDRLLEPGDSTAITERADNVHWFDAETEVVTFDVAVGGLDAMRGYDHRIDFVDPDRAVPEGDLLRAPRIGAKEAIVKYGRA